MPAAYPHPTPDKKRHSQKQARWVLLGLGGLAALSWWTHRPEPAPRRYTKPPPIVPCTVRIEADGSLTHVPNRIYDDNWPDCEIEVLNP